MTAQITAPTDLPSLPGLPFLGNLLEFRNNRLALLMRVTQRHWDLGIVQIGSRTVVIKQGFSRSKSARSSGSFCNGYCTPL